MLFRVADNSKMAMMRMFRMCRMMRGQKQVSLCFTAI